MSEPSPITIQRRDVNIDNWSTFEVTGVPVNRASKIRIDFNSTAAAHKADELIAAIRGLVEKTRGAMIAGQTQPQPLPRSSGESLLEVVVCDGQQPVPMQSRLSEALAAE